MNFLEIAQTRQSCRSFDESRVVEQEKLDAILEAVRLAPSACNGQPYHLTVCRGEKAKQVAKATQKMGMNKFASQAPVLVVVSEAPYVKSAAMGAKLAPCAEEVGLTQQLVLLDGLQLTVLDTCDSVVDIADTLLSVGEVVVALTVTAHGVERGLRIYKRAEARVLLGRLRVLVSITHARELVGTRSLNVRVAGLIQVADTGICTAVVVVNLVGVVIVVLLILQELVATRGRRDHSRERYTENNLRKYVSFHCLNRF